MSYNIRMKRQIVFEAWDQLYSSLRLIIFQTKTEGANYRRVLSHTSQTQADFVSLERFLLFVFFYIVKVVSRWPGRQGIQILYIVWAILYPDHAMQHRPIFFCWQKTICRLVAVTRQQKNWLVQLSRHILWSWEVAWQARDIEYISRLYYIPIQQGQLGDHFLHPVESSRLFVCQEQI